VGVGEMSSEMSSPEEKMVALEEVRMRDFMEGLD
jgi:hypothetical protein